MTIRSFLSRSAIIGAGLFLASAASAATVSEADFGDFSANFWAPTQIAAGTATITGTWSGGEDYDMLWLTLPTGAQTVSLTFSVPGAVGYSYSAGGTIIYKDSPFQYSAWGEGTQLGTVHRDYYNTGDLPFTITLDSSFGGSLYLALFGTYGALNYTLTANAVVPEDITTPPAVPLPAGVWLLGSGLAAAGVFGAKRRKRV